MARHGRGRVRRLLPRHWLLWTMGVIVVVAAAGGVYAWREYRILTSAKYNVVNYTVPTAPHLVAGPGETVYRIDPTQSQVELRGRARSCSARARTRPRERRTASPATSRSTRRNPAASRVGQIVVNVEQLHSDNNLRDARMRAGRTSTRTTTRSPTSRSPTSSGMPASITEGTHVPLHDDEPAHREEDAGAR